MGSLCCQEKRIEFSKSISLDDLKLSLAEERKKYDSIIVEYEDNKRRTLLEKQLLGIDINEALNELSRMNTQPQDSLEYFLEGVTESQNELNDFGDKEYQQLGAILDEYFQHALDNDNTQMKPIRLKLKNFTNQNNFL